MPTSTFPKLHRVRLPDGPGPRKNSKPVERYGWAVQEPWPLPGRVLVLKDGDDWPLWVPVGVRYLTSEGSPLEEGSSNH